MSHDYKHRSTTNQPKKRRHKSSKNPKPIIPVWLAFLLGLAIGAFATGLYLLADTPAPIECPPQPALECPVLDAPEPITPPPSGYDFYNILPDMEVTVPDSAQIPPARSKPPTPASNTDVPANANLYFLQVGSFPDMGRADTMRAKLGVAGFESKVQIAEMNNSVFYRVRVGPYTSRRDAERVERRLRAENFDVFLAVQKPAKAN